MCDRVGDPVQAAAEADPADVPAVRHTEGGRVHGQVLPDPQGLRQLRRRGLPLRAGGESATSVTPGGVTAWPSFFLITLLPTARLEPGGGAGHRREGDSPTHAEEFSGEHELPKIKGQAALIFNEQLGLCLKYV